MAVPPVDLRITATDRTRGAFNAVRGSLGALQNQITSLRAAGLKLGLALSGIGLAVGGLAVIGQKSIDVADDLLALAQKTGITVEKLSLLKVAAEASNTSLDAVAIGAKKLASVMFEAAQGSTKAAKLIGAFGVQAGDELSTAFEKILRGLGQIPNAGQRSAIAVKLLGKSGTELIPLAREFADTLQLAKDLNLEISTRTAKAADQFNDSIGILKQALSVGFLEGLTPALEEFNRELSDPATVASIRQLGSSVGSAATFIIQNFDAITDAVTVLGAAFAVNLGGRAVAALTAHLTAIRASTAAELERIALQRASLAATVQSTAAEAARTVAIVASAQAAAAAAAGQARLSLILGTVVPAQRAAAAAAAVHTAALEAQAVAASAAATSAGIARGALALLGGPIGAITTALTLGATAWLIWGNKAEAAARQASDAVENARALSREISQSAELAAAGGSRLAVGLEKLDVEQRRLTQNLAAIQRAQAAAPVGGSLLDPFGFGDESKRLKLKADADKTIADLRETQRQIDNLRALRDQGAEKAQAGPDLSGLLGDPKGSARAAKAAGDQTKGLIDASLAATKDALEREQRILDESLEDELISFRDYYAKRTAIAVAGIDAEIAAKRNLLSSSGGEGEAAKITAEITILENKRNDVILGARREQIAAEKELVDQLLQVRARVFEAEGKTAEATRIRVEAEFSELTKRLEAEGDTAGVQIVKRLFNIEVARGQLTQLEAEVERTRQQLSRDEGRVNVEVETGLTGELAGRREIVRLHTETAEKLRPIVDQMRVIAQTIGPEEVARVAGLSAEIDNLGTVTDEVANSLNNEFKNAAASAFKDFITGTKTASQAFADFGSAVLDAIAEIAAKNLAESLFGNLFKTSAGSGGFDIAKIFSFFAHHGGVVGALGPPRAVPALAFAGAPRLHDGGMLGLRSNEVPAILQRGEEVLTRDDPRHRANRGEGAVNVVMNITSPDAQGFRRSQGQIMADVAIGLGRARRNLP